MFRRGLRILLGKDPEASDGRKSTRIMHVVQTGRVRNVFRTSRVAY